MKWTETDLWTAITEKAAENDLLTLQNCMPQIETVLRSAGTSPIDFTLHDDQHSARVAQRMFDIIKRQKIVLSGVELCQLLLSAYLHDIGMSPSRSVIDAHYKYLCTGQDHLINPLQKQRLQQWMDENRPNVAVPLSGMNTATGIDLAQEICAYYCRACHNDWSEEWIDENLKNVSPGLYPGWDADLITLCKSHHEASSGLLESKYDARLVGPNGETFNLRYLASILRLADALEFDPERTPDIILRHRSILPNSRVYWYRDHNISFSIGGCGDRLIFSARTPNAIVHNAVLSVADLVNEELASCNNLNLQGAYLRNVMKEEDKDRYIWKMPSRLDLDIRERDESFVYIDGTFRPDVPRLLELLSGTQLYQDRFAAVRELIQNAADAIAEQIGYERLRQDDADNPEHERTFGGLHKVKLAFEGDDDGRYWLRCTDDGVGLTKALIQKRLLRSGSSERPEFKALQREAMAKGFEVFRTGQFGIGLLSYFMIADRVEFSTRRSDAARDSDNASWDFVTEGVGGFGELKKGSRDKHGTDVRLRLRDGIVGSDPDGWVGSLFKYVRRTVRKLPCKIELRNSRSATPSLWEAGPGWTTAPSDFAENLFRGQIPVQWYDEIITLEKEASRERALARWTEVLSAANERLRWFGPVVTETEKYVARLWLPYFELEGGASVVFFDLENGQIQSFPDETDGALPEGRLIVSWKGFAIRMRHNHRLEFGVIEVDFVSGADIEISRREISAIDSSELDRTLELITKKARDQFLAAHESSHFLTANIAALRLVKRYAQSIPGNCFWKKGRNWQCISYPFAVVPRPNYVNDEGGSCLSYRGQDIPALAPVRLAPQSGRKLHLGPRLGSPKLGIIKTAYSIGPVGLWTGAPASNQLLWTSIFPEGWRKLLCVRANGIHFWNADHEIVKLANRDPDTRESGAGIEIQFHESTSSASLAAHLLLRVLTADIELLAALKDRHALQFEKFVTLLGGDKNPIYWWNFDGHHSRDTMTCMVTSAKVSKLANGWVSRGGELILPDGEALSMPDDPDHTVLETPREEEIGLTGNGSVVD